MNQTELIDAAKQQRGLTSDYSLAQALGIRSSRVSELRSLKKYADEAEIFMLADMAGVDPHIAAAGVRIDREKSPSKKAYWERILTQYAVASTVAATVIVEKISGNFKHLLSCYSPRPA